MFRVQYYKNGEWVTWASGLNKTQAHMYLGLMKYRFAEYDKRIIQDAA